MLQQLQTNNSTFYGRYWNETHLLRRYVPSDQDLKILSFGCSTGEELVLLKKLFPAARLFGCEHDWSNMLAARGLVGGEATVFHSDANELVRHGPFDVIVCNSVLMAPSVAGADGPQGLPYALWTDIVAQLDAVLTPGGILQVINSNFPFRIHPCAIGYQPLRSPLLLGANFADVYSAEGHRLCTGVAGVGLSSLTNVHVAEENWSGIVPDDLTDVHFQKAGGVPASPVLHQLLPNMWDAPVRARGESRHVVVLPFETDRASYVTVSTSWTTVGADGVRILRSAVRRWFDGSDLPPQETVIEMYGPLAAAFFEGTLGRPSTRLILSSLEHKSLIYSPIF